MKGRRQRFNAKRRIAEGVDGDALRRLAARVRYGGNPEHKRNPGDFSLTPPVAPRPDKSLCDQVAVFERKQALRLLRQGVKLGLISAPGPDGLPQNIWSVAPDGTPLEAQLENRAQATYHGYPLPASDPFADVVRRAAERARHRRG